MISDGKWHSVWIQHRKRITQIRIDSNKPAKLHSNNVQKVYLSNGKVFIGKFIYTSLVFLHNMNLISDEK